MILKKKIKKTTTILNPCFSSHIIHNQNGGPNGFCQFHFRKVHGLLKKENKNLTHVTIYVFFCINESVCSILKQSWKHCAKMRNCSSLSFFSVCHNVFNRGIREKVQYLSNSYPPTLNSGDVTHFTSNVYQDNFDTNYQENTFWLHSLLGDTVIRRY